MKKYLFPLSILITLFFFSCDEDKVLTFHDGHEIFFDKFYMNAFSPGTEEADSTVTSFFFYPEGTTDITVPVEVQLSGTPLTSEIKFGLRVIEEETTANPNEYDLDDFYVFHTNTIGEDAKVIKDTIYIKLIKSDRLDDLPEGVRLVVELVPPDGVGLGQVERRRAKIIMTSVAMQPEWWTQEVVDGLLGKYSQKKYQLFLNNIDKEARMGKELIEEHPDEAIKLVMEFKEWLAEQPIEDITDIDGSIIEVAI
ncbi:DUF4843 domain-containing protein [Gabonibacter massiliensis]|uniref:DUF4843 domain-containing protein n=1 Tax=Gabonibacter massiliensis TaxID=1720195 RepID=UPI00073E248C|nr:DUF4843 domain-containing protein [Gabonibacter massiliensis]